MRVGLPVLAGLAVLLSGSITPGLARAQVAPSGVDPNPAWTPPLFLQPLQLSLTAPDFVPGERLVPGCEDEARTTGNTSLAGIPRMYSLGVPSVVPRLTLTMFSRLGCPLSSGIGAAATYVAPLGSGWSFVLSGGTYAMPQILERSAAYKTIVRAGVAKANAAGGITHTGLELMNVRGTSRLGFTYGMTF